MISDNIHICADCGIVYSDKWYINIGCWEARSCPVCKSQETMSWEHHTKFCDNCKAEKHHFLRWECECGAVTRREER